MAVVGCVSGFRTGLVRQIPSVLGAAFGIVAARTAAPGVAVWIMRTWPELAREPLPDFLPMALAAGGLYMAFFLMMLCAGPLFEVLLRPLGCGILNSLAGAVWGCLKWLICLSVMFNIAIGIDHDSPLLESSRHGDGNIAAGCMLIAPALLGTDDCDELAYRMQLLDAKKISCNFAGRHYVIIKESLPCQWKRSSEFPTQEAQASLKTFFLKCYM